ncbi:hypothetical protein B566_EDAN018600 [Ephemera danica]|nr:hypothetical protein B566_EDAN018600 [Ephemera danica]
METATYAFWVIAMLVALALLFDFMNGFHDAANSIATVVSTGVLRPQTAVLFAAFFNVVAILFFQLKVAATVGKGIVEPGVVDVYVVFGALIGAITWNRAVSGLACPLVHFTPAGQPLTQALVQEFAAGPGAVLLCGRYEGVDQRFLDKHQAIEISLGDFVLSGGELPALALLDAVARLQPGVLSEPSHQQDSFSQGLLEGPQYSRPETWPLDAGPQGAAPAVLLSGHHQRIARWQREQALATTARRRPELVRLARQAGRLSPADEAFLNSLSL